MYQNGEGNIDEVFHTNSDWAESTGHTQNQQNVEQVGTNHVTNCQTAFAFAGSHKGGHQFRQGSTHCHDGQSDEVLAETQRLSDCGSGINDQVAAEYNSDETTHDVNQGHERGENFDFFFLRSFRTTLQCRAHHQQDKACKEHQHDAAFQVTHLHTGEGKEQEQEGCANGHWKVAFDEAFFNRNRVNHSAETQNHQQIEDVGTNHVAQSDGIAAVETCGDGNSRFRSAGTHSHDGQTDDDGWNFQKFSHRGAAFYEVIRAFDQQYEADQQ